MAIKESKARMGNYRIHTYSGGKGYPILMLHGSGAGASSFGNWHAVMKPLSRRYKVLAGDLIGFGKSDQKSRMPYFDINLWMREAQLLLDRLSKNGPVGVIGHSLSGYFALRLASRNKRIDKVMVTGSLGAKYKLTDALRAGWTFPKTEKDFRDVYSRMVADTSLMTDEFVADRMRVLHSGNYGEYFSKMFSGNKQSILNQCVLTKAELRRIKCDVVMLHGAQDTPVPFDAAAVPLANAIPQADLVRLANCGHGPAMDQPGKFLEVARNFFG